MKKYLLILILSFGAIQAQTLQNPTFGNTTTNTLKIKTNTTSATATDVSVQETDGSLNKMTPENLPISQPPHPINYSVLTPTLGAHLIGIDDAIGRIGQTTAGVTNRIYFTGDNTTVNSVVYFASNATGKGSTPSASPTNLVNGDDQKQYFAKDIISIAQPANTISAPGIYSGQLSVMVDSDVAQERYTVEIYKTNNLGVPISSGITGAPVGDLGVTVIAILDSSVLDLSASAITNITVSGTLTEQLTLNTGERVRYHVSAAKVGTAGSNVTFSVYYGSNHSSYYDVPVATTTDGVVNKSTVTGLTTTGALDALNTGKVGGSGVNGQVSFWSGTNTQSGDNAFLWDNTNKKLGLNTSAIDSNVSDFKIGNRVPTDDNNVMAISKDYSAGNAIYNGLNIEIKSTSTVDNDVRANRALKSVSLVDPNGYILSNQGGSGIGVEGVARMQGLGTVKALTGGYFRVLQDTNDPLSILEVAAGVVVPTPGGFSGAPIGTSVGINVNEQNYLSRSTNSINVFLGSPNLGALLPVGLTGRYSIYNMSDEQNYFKYRLGLNITTPTEMLDVVGNAKISDNLGVGTVSTSARVNLSGSITGSTTAYGIFNQPTIQSGVTSIAYYNRTTASTQAASFTVASIIHNSATQGTFGAGSTVTNQYGYIAASSLVGATNNYGFRSQIPSNASANWNIYADGTAPNYFNGNVGVATLPAVSATDKLQVNGNITASTATASNHVVVKSQLDLKSDIASPTFTGDPKAPTATAGDNDTSIATTAFVTGAIATADAGNVKLTGNQSISGVKTFSESTGVAVNAIASASYSAILGQTATTSSAIQATTTSSTGAGVLANIGASGSGFAYIGQNNGTNTFTVNKTGDVTANTVTLANVLKLKAYTVGTLPTGAVGDMAYVTDALAPTYNTTVVGGGAIRVPVFYNGTNWTAH